MAKVSASTANAAMAFSLRRNNSRASFIQIARRAPWRQAVQTRAGLIDITPTILDAAGLRIPEAVQGQSFYL